MRKLDTERLTMIKADTPFLRSQTQKLNQAGLSELVTKALSDTHQGRNIAGDREIVKTLAQKFTVQSVDFHGSKKATEENIRKRINELVKRLETNAIVIAVDTDKYWPAVYDKKHLSAKKGDLFPEEAQHVVILAGYEISDDTFFVRDSNFKKVIAVKAKDIALSTEWAGFYKQIRS
jgi:transcriptional regulator of met regulon